MRWSDRLQRRDPRFLPQEAARRRTQRQGNRDRDAILRRHADVRNPGHARRADGRDLDRRHLRQDGRPHQDPPPDGRELPRDSRQRGIRQAAGQRSAGAGSDQRGREQRHRVPRRDRQDLRARRPHRRRRLARRRAARPAAADRRHHGLDQARRGEDRPHPVHRLRRVPYRQAVGPVAGIAGPPADPRRAGGADARRHAPHPDRAGGLADQAICRADADRGRDARHHRRRHRRAGRRRGRRQFDGGEYRRAAAADRDGARAGRDFLRRAGPPRRDHQGRCRLRAEARRRSRQERRFEPVYFV